MRVAFITTDSREHFKTYHRPEPYFGAAPEAVLAGMAKVPELEVHVISCCRTPLRTGQQIAANIWYHSLHVPKSGWMTTGYFGCIRAVRRLLRTLQPDLVHGQGTERDCAMDAVFSRYPNVLTLHGNMLEIAQVSRARPGSFLWLATRLENLALRRTAGVFCNSAHTEQLVKPRARRTWRVPNPLRSDLLTRPKPDRPPPKGRFLNVGVVCDYKQQIALLEMAARLAQAHPCCHLHFIGDASPQSPYAAEFLARVGGAEKGGYASYRDRLPADGLIEAYDSSVGLVHTPKSEAFGLVVAEALARNLKVFAMRVGGVQDIAQGAPGAVLVEPGDWAGLEREIRVWLEAGCPAPGASRELMASRYDPVVIARRHLEIYREVLGR